MGNAKARSPIEPVHDIEDEPTVRRSRTDMVPSYAFRAPDPVCGNHLPLLAHHYARPSVPAGRRRAPRRQRTSSTRLSTEKLIVVLAMSAVIGLPSGWLAWLLIDAFLPT